MLKETISHTVYKNNEYSNEPSSVFLYYEDNEEYFGFHCYFCKNYKDYKNVAIIKDVEFSENWKFEKHLFEKYIEDIFFYLKKFNKKWNRKFSKILFFNYFNIKKYNKIILDKEEYLVYEI